MEKTAGQELQENLFYKKKNYYEESSEKELTKIFTYAESYKNFLNAGKTERESQPAEPKAKREGIHASR